VTRSDGPLRGQHEISLMLSGTKPLAVFNDLVFVDGAEDEIDLNFKRHVESGRLVFREDRDDWPEPRRASERLAVGSRLRLYALPEERWRIDAYLLMTRASRGVPWSDALERLARSLLGYSEEETAAYISRFHERHGAWGTVPAYLGMSNADLEKLRLLGFKAVPPDLGQAVLLVLCDVPPTPAVLKSIHGEDAPVLVRLGLDTKFVRELPLEQAGDISIVRLSADSIPKINLNLRSAIEVLSSSGNA
jgi:hypothetical protein